MLEASGDPYLPKKAVGTQRGGELIAQQLDGNQAAVLEVVGQIDGGHAAATKLALDAVATSQGSCQREHGVGQDTLCEDCLKMGSLGVAG
jgi:hypothetical protein